MFDAVCWAFFLGLVPFFRGVFYPCLRRLSRQKQRLSRANNVGNVFVGMMTCVSCSFGVLRVRVSAVFYLCCWLINLDCICRVSCQALRTPRHPNLAVDLVSETQSMCTMVHVQGPERTKRLHILTPSLDFMWMSGSGWYVTWFVLSFLVCFVLTCDSLPCLV